MILIPIALVVGVLVGLATGGRLRALTEIRFRWWPLAFVGLALQRLPIPSMAGELDEWIGAGLLVASYLVLLAFVAVNIRLPGFPLLALGFAMNAVVVTVNGGMPVGDSALREAFGSQYQDARQDLVAHGGTKHHLAREDDVLVPLADVIPVGPPVRQVVSVGDIVWLVGTAWAVAGVMRATRRDAQWLARQG